MNFKGLPVDERGRGKRRKGWHHKYGVAPPDERVHNGILYDSKGEMQRAKVLLANTRALGPRFVVIRQVNIPLGPDFKTRVDWMVFDRVRNRLWAEEFKGRETPPFRKIRQLWPKYADFPMHIVKRYGKNWAVEILPGRFGDHEDEDQLILDGQQSQN